MNVSEKIKAINSKIEQNKTQYDLNRQTAKISPLWSGSLSKYEFLTGKDILLERVARKSWYIENIWIFTIR